MNYLEILTQEKVFLPDEYYNYITSDKFSPDVFILNDDCPFYLFSLVELCKETTVDKISKIQAKILIGYAKTLREFVLDNNNTVDQKGTKFSLDRLSNWVTIGTENSRLLFADPSDNYSLGIFHPDGGDGIKLIANIYSLIE